MLGGQQRNVVLPTALGRTVNNNGAQLDHSNTSEGYVTHTAVSGVPLRCD
ncbi:hypothetical protein Avbf_07287 [Armadillidium vulgare]|nr:hypothetical protein Avbf_07287 [Armadillidium vulgare]